MDNRSMPGVFRGFTLIEIMMTIVILGILATIAIPAYQNFIEDGKDKMCRQNLAALEPELKIYVVEHNVVPGDVGQLPRDRVEKALAKARAGAPWNAKLIMFFEEQKDRGLAFADMVQELAKGNFKMLLCPSDPRRKNPKYSGDLISYGISKSIVGMNKEQYLALDDEIVVLSDSYETEFTGRYGDETVDWHKHYGSLISGGVFNTVAYGNAVTKGGWPRSVGKSPEIKKRKDLENAVLNNAGLSKSERKKKLRDIWRWR